MKKQIRRVGWIIILNLCFTLVCFNPSSAGDKELTPEEVVSNHLKSIGSPEVLAGIKSRAFSGSATMNFIVGAIGDLTGQCEFVSEKQKLGIFCRYDALEYPQEHFAFDGKDVTVSYISPGRRSPLGDFLSRYDGIIKSGLMGGVLSVNWPLLNIEKSRAKMKYSKTKIDGRELHELEYRPRKGMGDVKVRLYFDSDTFRHVKTEYKVTYVKQGTIKPISEIHADSLDVDVHYVLSEEYGDFREVDGLTLPHSYSAHYSRQEGTSTYMVRWTIHAEQWSHNTPIDPQFFHIQ